MQTVEPNKNIKEPKAGDKTHQPIEAPTTEKSLKNLAPTKEPVNQLAEATLSPEQPDPAAESENTLNTSNQAEATTVKASRESTVFERLDTKINEQKEWLLKCHELLERANATTTDDTEHLLGELAEYENDLSYHQTMLEIDFKKNRPLLKNAQECDSADQSYTSIIEQFSTVRSNVLVQYQVKVAKVCLEQALFYYLMISF